MTRLRDYKTILFDCDGVLLDSNEVKSRAFFEAALPYGVDAARRFVEDHQARGGVSRYTKIRDFFSNILGRKDRTEEEQTAMLARFAEAATRGQLTCPEASGVRDLLDALKEEAHSMFVVSGSAENELREVLSARNLSTYFDGIFGSPKNKLEIISSLASAERLQTPAVFLGDSHADLEAAKAFNLHFVMISAYTEWRNHENALATYPHVTVARTPRELI